MRISPHDFVRCALALVVVLLVSGCGSDDEGGVLLEDDFAEQRPLWPVDEGEVFAYGYDQGEYFIELYEPEWLAWVHPGRRVRDVQVETDAYLKSGSADNHFGLLCRYVDIDNFYYFAISSDGYYGIFRRVDGAAFELLSEGGGMVPSAAIRIGDQVNRVRVVCAGDEMSLYVNDELLETVIDVAHPRGDVGLAAGSGGGEGTRIHFDHVLVTELPE